jgi:predicted RNA polymerase sigma factor
VRIIEDIAESELENMKARVSVQMDDIELLKDAIAQRILRAKRKIQEEKITTDGLIDKNKITNL